MRQQEIVLESYFPHLAEPSTVSPALVGWSASAENALAFQAQQTAHETVCEENQETSQQMNHESNEELINEPNTALLGVGNKGIQHKGEAIMFIANFRRGYPDLLAHNTNAMLCCAVARKPVQAYATFLHLLTTVLSRNGRIRQMRSPLYIDF